MRALVLAVLLAATASISSAQQIYAPHFGAGGFSYQPTYIGPSRVYQARTFYAPMGYGGYYLGPGGGFDGGTGSYWEYEAVEELRAQRYAPRRWR